MFHSTTRLITLLAALCLALLVATPLFAEPTITAIAGFAWFDQPPQGGTLKCIGGTPTGSWPPCTPGSKAQLRNVNMHSVQVVPGVPHLSGTRTLVFNANFDASGKGHAWGSWRAEHANGGVSEGTFTAFPTGWGGPNVGRAVGRHTEGPLEGALIFLTISYEQFPNGVETLEGYLLDPKGR